MISDRGLLFLVSVGVMLASLGAAVWLVVTGQAAYLDGIFLLVTCLVLAFAFGLYAASMLKRALSELKAPASGTAKAAAAGARKETVASEQPVSST